MTAGILEMGRRNGLRVSQSVCSPKPLIYSMSSSCLSSVASISRLCDSVSQKINLQSPMGVEGGQVTMWVGGQGYNLLCPHTDFLVMPIAHLHIPESKPSCFWSACSLISTLQECIIDFPHLCLHLLWCKLIGISLFPSESVFFLLFIIWCIVWNDF